MLCFFFFFFEKEPHALLVIRIWQNTNRLIHITQNRTKVVFKFLICGTGWQSIQILIDIFSKIKEDAQDGDHWNYFNSRK